MSEFTEMLGAGQREPTVHTQARLPDGTWEDRDEVLRTRSGRVLTEADIDALADEAERGYDPATFRPRVRMPRDAAGAIAIPSGPHYEENMLAITEAMAEGFRARRRAPISLALRRLWFFLLGWGTPPRRRRGARWAGPAPQLIVYDEVAPFSEADVERFKRRWEEQFAPPAATPTQEEDHDG